MAKILLVEDDDIQRMTYRRFLELESHRVIDVADGMAALKAFHADPSFDIVVTDVLMPGEMDGSGLIYDLRKLRPRLPILAISAGRRVLSPDFALESASFAGSTMELPKPISRQHLKQAIEKMLAAA